MPVDGDNVLFPEEEEQFSMIMSAGRRMVLERAGDLVLLRAGKVCSRYTTSPVKKIRDVFLFHNLAARAFFSRPTKMKRCPMGATFDFLCRLTAKQSKPKGLSREVSKG